MDERAIARTIERYACAWDDPHAVRFCAVGARVAAGLLGDEARARSLGSKWGVRLPRLPTAAALGCPSTMIARATLQSC